MALFGSVHRTRLRPGSGRTGTAAADHEPRGGSVARETREPRFLRERTVLATKKIRVYELARELGVENHVIVELSNELKIGVKSHSSSIDEPSADRVRRLADSRGLRKEVVPEPEPEPAPTPEPEPGPAPAAGEVEPEPAPDPEPEPAPERSRRVVRSSAQPLPPRPPETFERTTPLTERRPGAERPISPITDKPAPVDRPAAASLDTTSDPDVAAPPSRP